MAKLKVTKLIMPIVLAALLISLVSAIVVTYADWQDGTLTKTINKGETAYFDLGIFSTQPPMSYSVKMYDSNDNLIKTWYNNVQDASGGVEVDGITVTPPDYANKGGAYEIDVISSDASNKQSSTKLTLNVINHAPAIGWTYLTTPVNEGENVFAMFGASDADNDTLTYSIYRNGVLISNSGYNLWTTNYNDAGTYIYTFSVSDGEAETTQTSMLKVIDVPQIPVTPTANTEIEIYHLNIAPVSIDNGQYIKIKNNAHSISGVKMKITSVDTNEVKYYNLDIPRNSVKLVPMGFDFAENNSYLLRIDISSNDFDGKDYLLVEN
jgi:hypothetical protein